MRNRFKTKKLPIVFSAILIFALGIAIGFGLGKNKHSQNDNFREGKGGFVGEYKVTRVIDGDTIEIEGGERVRYIGMDTPETVDPNGTVECFGPEATQENKKLVEGKTVRLEKDISERDDYGRLLRYVYVDDVFVNLELVNLGYARFATYLPDISHQDEIYQAQAKAKKSSLGMWGACGEK
jgi:micrococcal nuclease